MIISLKYINTAGGEFALFNLAYMVVRLRNAFMKLSELPNSCFNKKQFYYDKGFIFSIPVCLLI